MVSSFFPPQSNRVRDYQRADIWDAFWYDARKIRELEESAGTVADIRAQLLPSVVCIVYRVLYATPSRSNEFKLNLNEYSGTALSGPRVISTMKSKAVIVLQDKNSHRIDLTPMV
jgi:hypothetical protein